MQIRTNFILVLLLLTLFLCCFLFSKQVLEKKNVFNNCIGKEEKDSSPVIDSSNYLLYAEKLKPKSDGMSHQGWEGYFCNLLQ